jgi:tetratricopeptide (TPR) repeat protein
MLASLWDSEYSVRKMAENAIWGLWLRADDPYIDSVFQRAIVEVQGSEYEIALQMFKNVTELKPEFAEGWNKLGDVYFALDDFENAVNSFYKTLELNSYQFGTMESLGYLMMELQREKEALKWFNMALDINPNLIHLAEIVNNLKERFGDKNI